MVLKVSEVPGFDGFRGSESGSGFAGFGVPGLDGFRRFRDQELQKACGTKFLPSWGWHNTAGNAVRRVNAFVSIITPPCCWGYHLRLFLVHT